MDTMTRGELLQAGTGTAARSYRTHRRRTMGPTRKYNKEQVRTKKEHPPRHARRPLHTPEKSPLRHIPDDRRKYANPTR